VEDVRIWITGAGLVTALGRNTRKTWELLVAGERGFGPVDLFDVTGQRATIAASVRGIDLPDHSGGWSRTSVFAREAAEEALVEAGVSPRSARVGLVVGGTTGGMFETEARLAKLHAEPHTREGKKALSEMLTHPLTSTGDRLFECLGPFVCVRTICSACSSGANALVIGALWLLSGKVDAVLAGGSDGLCRLTFSGFNALAAMDPDPCRPFDRRRRGLSLGEGAGFAVLERASDARTRGRTPIAELAGWALAAEAHHITNPEPAGKVAAGVVRDALLRARISPAEVDYVNAHGTGTPLNDAMESAALRLALGEESHRIPVSSSKGQIGHTLGAAGAVEAILTALAVARGVLPPTIGLEEPDAACDLVHVMSAARPSHVRAALSNSFGFGGMDTVLVISQPDHGPPLEPSARKVVVTGASTLTPAGFLGARGSAALLAGPSRTARARPLDIEIESSLEAARARRLDRPARLGAMVAVRALAGDDTSQPNRAVAARSRVGAVFGSAFGSVDASAAFMHRLFDRGPRFASPAEFPNLVPSSPVGHVSIYLGLRGATLATADLATSGESAIVQAVELVAAGEADAIVAGSIEGASDIAERILVGLFARSSAEVDTPRAEGAAALVLEAQGHAEAREAHVLARIGEIHEWREGAELPLRSIRLSVNPSMARVILPRDHDGMGALLDDSPWRAVARLSLASSAGQHEGLGGIALAAGAGLLGEGDVQQVLIVGLAIGRGYALTLDAP
jgi:3-oxoacyl-[acyl-carrier-protein] synthase II